jgi:hypothetical protein
MASDSINDIFGNAKPSGSQPQLSFPDTGPDGLPGYTVIKSNWFTAKPYGFKFTPRTGKAMTMFLPIAPSNLTISTGFATSAIATLYGTVEEHSPVRYYDIAIEGTTGMAPKFVDVDQKEQNLGRSTYPVSQSLAGAASGGFFSKTLSLIDKIRNTASEIASGTPVPKTGVYVNQTGYVAFHNLYRFLLKYKQDVSSDADSTVKRSEHPLTFFNYKDNNQYDVVVRGFTLRRSADNPMLYNYSIQLRGYNLRSVSDEAKDLTADRLKLLGLDGVDGSSFLAKIKGTSNKVKGILGPLGAGINILGR